jgi:tRNA dimethylallyltransferase
MQKIIVVLGTNASGKSSLGVELAKTFSGEIISADSRQVYKGFDLCCGKITASEMQGIPHYLLNICKHSDVFSVADFQYNAYKLIPEIINKGKNPFIVGGTGLYIDSVVYGYILTDNPPNYELRKTLNDMELDELLIKCRTMGIPCGDNNSEMFNKRRVIRLIEKASMGESLEKKYEPRYQSLQLGVTWPKDILFDRIDDRLSLRIKNGMIDEVDSYIREGGDPAFLCGLGLEYKYIYWYLSGKYKSFEEFYRELSRAIKYFSKRQLTWFKRNSHIKWLDMEKNYLQQAKDSINEYLCE